MVNPKTYKSFKEIVFSKESFIEKIPKKYFAHTSLNKKKETLFEHIEKTRKNALRIVKYNNLEVIINGIVAKIDFKNIEIGNFIKELFISAILFHDLGKINPNFQYSKMTNSNFEVDKNIKIDTKHSFLSSYIFINYYSEKIFSNKQVKNNEKYYLFGYIFLFCIPILKHHSNTILKDYNFSENIISTIHKLLSILEINFPIEKIKNLIKNENRIWEKFSFNFDHFSLFALLKLNYSLLTASDYLATSDYMNEIKFETETDFGLLTNDLKQKLIHNFDNNKDKDWNGKLIKNPEKYLKQNISDLQKANNINLNILRQKMAAEVLTNIEKYKDKKIFYIEAPTGGGKTNMSMVAVRKMLELHPEINKIFYVFPFTTLITQTAKAIKETFNLSHTDIAQIHSKAGLKTKDYESDARYGSELRNQIDNIFVNYPIALLTHIKFFDVLKTNRKETNYLLHRLANSVVIIDELQVYSPKEWDKVKFYISKYSELFNIRFIIMSATLPRLDTISITDEKITGKNFEKYEELIQKAQDKYLTNPNFAERVKINTDLLNNKNTELPELAEIVLEKSKEYAQNRTDDYKGSIYTIIEFIFKKSASEFYVEIKKIENGFFDNIFVLSGTIIEPRRKYIIDYLKDEKNRKKKILLITTQVVEAGVDIDMDLGFKNQSLIDSDEQLAGRINRNVNKQNCELYLFRKDDPKVIYGKDDRFDITRKEFSNKEVKEILETKNFKKLYDRVIDKIKKLNKSVTKQNFVDYKNYFKNLNFKEINDKFKLIDQENASIFVPLDIDIHCYGDENNFSEDELKFAENNNLYADENPLKISGEKVWDLYVSLINNKEFNFSKRQIELKKLNGIISKFVFSVFTQNARKMQQCGYFDYNGKKQDFKNYKYFKLLKEFTGENNLYSLESGINENQLDEKTFSDSQFF